MDRSVVFEVIYTIHLDVYVRGYGVLDSTGTYIASMLPPTRSFRLTGLWDWAVWKPKKIKKSKYPEWL